MNIVKTGTKYRLFDRSVETGDKLPPMALEVGFSKFEGFYLVETDMPDIRGEKVYGDSEKKVAKVLSAYAADASKNLGVILSGQKGIGKTLFAKLVSSAAIADGLPVIYVNEYFTGLPGFFRHITQDCVVVFDEFDKNFISNSSEDRDQTACQDELLTMFDGVYGGHKLFVITCNEVSKLSDYYVNRPGRFRYHIRFGYPDCDEVEKYLKDKLGDHKDIASVVRFSGIVPLSYDCLSAIAAELKAGETFANAMEMLNIVNLVQNADYTIRLRYEVNGHEVLDTLTWSDTIPMFADDGTECNTFSYNVYFPGDDVLKGQYMAGRASFVPAVVRKKGKSDRSGAITVGPEGFSFKHHVLDPDANGTEESQREKTKRVNAIMASVRPLSLTFIMDSVHDKCTSYAHVL